MSETEVTELKDLIKKRGSIKGRVTNFKKYLVDVRETKIFTRQMCLELELRLGKLEALFTEFDKIQTDIEVLQEATDEQDQYAERGEIESQFYSLISTAQEILDSHGQGKQCEREPVASLPSVHSSASCKIGGIKLPTIKLPSFNGDYNKWLEFRDTFDSLIHENKELNNINKFHYLRSSLEGSAAIVIKSLETSADNYLVAWKLICERYNNKRQLIYNHLRSLFNVEPIKRESDVSLRFLVDHIAKNLRALNSLGEPTDNWDTLIIFMFSSKLDTVTSRKWEEYKNTLIEIPTLRQFSEFLRNRADVLETLFMQGTGDKCFKQGIINAEKEHLKLDKVQKAFVASAVEGKAYNYCLICSGEHPIYQCEKFKGMSVEARNEKISNLKLCINCFKKGHFAYQCRFYPCKICNKKHNVLLHKVNKTESSKGEGQASTSNPISLSTSISGQVLLSTALIQIVDCEGNQLNDVRALLDCGSQSSFITESLITRIGTRTEPVGSVNVKGINNLSFNALQRCKLSVKSYNSKFMKQIDCLIIPHITNNLPSNRIDISELNLPKNIKLADPGFYCPSQIDILLGADIFWEVIESQQIKLGHGRPMLQKSQFGWLVVGPTKSKSNQIIQCNFSKEMSDQLRKFWEIEEVQVKPKWTEEEQFCESHFIQNTCRIEQGRFCVKLPLQDKPKCLGNSYNMALNRFHSLERRFTKQPNLKKQYVDFLNEYEASGHMSKFVKTKANNYLPHHPVLREKSETTKCRVVFDASAKTSSGHSLNDLLMVGPTVQDDLLSILLRFRQHRFVVSGDIEKMYRQILVDESQRHLQTVLWRDEENKEMETYQLNTLTYGTSSAPYISTRCLLQIAKECSDPIIGEVIEHDFYVDDLLTGCNSSKQLKFVHDSVIDSLKSACFTLRKIKTNCMELFQNTKLFHQQESSILLDKDCSILGLNWNPSVDTLNISFSQPEGEIKYSKRVILSTTAKIFDPLGVLSVCTITCKVILQQLWQLKMNWDDEIPSDIKSKWYKIVNNLKYLSTLQIPRCVICNNPCNIEIHVFSDASLKAYASCVYVRSTDGAGNITVRLLCAKAKVAPLKPTTIPRLELCGALLASRLCDKVKRSLRCNIDRIIYWSDSKVVMGWLRMPLNKLKTYVTHRVSEIHDLSSPCSWKYVPSAENPADLASRGIYPNQLEGCVMWWCGPSFLSGDEGSWPDQGDTKSMELPEIKVLTVQLRSETIDVTGFSKFITLKHIFAYICRFINNCKKSNKDRRMYGLLSVDELNLAETKLILLSQREQFNMDINKLVNKQQLSPKSPLISLSPFLDNDGLIRVGGRLKNTNYDFRTKHPILLDSNHHFTKLLFHYEHIKLFHAGPQLLLSSIRERYWVKGGRRLARQVYRSCIKCIRMKGAVAAQIMGNLPEQRVTPGYPFSVVGVDYAGPYFICNKKGRGARVIKCYLCIFVCFKTKGCHLEAVSDLTTETFILSLKRFIARRGKPLEIFSDNGTKFVGASREIGSFIKLTLNSVSDFAANEGIKFNFSPAYSPNFGGLWEAAVKSAKYHIKRAVGSSHFSFEELTTLFAQVEAILNSRPICPMSSNPDDLVPLTPGHFLIGRPLTALPTPNFIDVDPSRLHRFAKIEQARQHFWSRWNKEYVVELQQKVKWRQQRPVLKLGQLVLVKGEQTPPLKWPLGRIVDSYPGSDGVCRVFDVKTSRGIIRRAVTRLCPLLMEHEEDS